MVIMAIGLGVTTAMVLLELIRQRQEDIDPLGERLVQEAEKNNVF